MVSQDLNQVGKGGIEMFKKSLWVSIDIETRSLNEEQIEFEAQFLKAHPNTKDPAKIKDQIEKKKENLLTKGACTNSAEIACIGVHTPDEAPIVLHTFDFSRELYTVDHVSYKTTSEMLEAFSALLDELCDQETVLVVAGKKFDLPKIRLEMAKLDLKMPETLLPWSNNPVFDVLFYGGKYFMVEGDAQHNVGVDELLKRFGIRKKGKQVTGAEIPGMIERGEYEEVILYNADDALSNSLLYQKMGGTIKI